MSDREQSRSDIWFWPRSMPAPARLGPGLFIDPRTRHVVAL